MNFFSLVSKLQDLLRFRVKQSLTPDNEDLPNDPRQTIRLGLIVLLVGFGGFLIWMFAADLDEGVPTSGNVIVDSRRKVIQHPTGGVVKKINVTDGEKVNAGAVLLQLVDTQAKAEYDVLKRQFDFYQSQIAAIKPMVDEGYYPKNQYLDLVRQSDELVIKLKVAQEALDRTLIRTPVTGVVMGTTISTVNGVIAPGAKLMEIVPDGDRLVIEVQIPLNLIDKVQPSLEAEVHLTALNQRTTPTLMGKVIWVSPDRQQDPMRPEINYYVARVQINDQSLDKIKDEVLVPGMPADVVIKTGSRTFWNYLVKPIVDRANLSLKER